MSQFDLEKTKAVIELFGTARESRDDAWVRSFYAAVPNASLIAFQPQVQLGPDQFPYFHLAVPDPGAFTPFSISHLLDNVIANGLGIAIFGDATRSKLPEWVFTYGDLLSFKLYNDFAGDPAVIAAPPAQGASNSVLVASPSESYLPTPARTAIGAYARRIFQMSAPKIALVDDAHGARVLMLNLTLADYHGDEGKLGSAMHYLSWFIPRTYRFVPMPPDWTDSNFTAI